jgi:hypothetical protein
MYAHSQAIFLCSRSMPIQFSQKLRLSVSWGILEYTIQFSIYSIHSLLQRFALACDITTNVFHSESVMFPLVKQLATSFYHLIFIRMERWKSELCTFVKIWFRCISSIYRTKAAMSAKLVRFCFTNCTWQTCWHDCFSEVHPKFLAISLVASSDLMSQKFVCFLDAHCSWKCGRNPVAANAVSEFTDEVWL